MVRVFAADPCMVAISFYLGKLLHHGIRRFLARAKSVNNTKNIAAMGNLAWCRYIGRHINTAICYRHTGKFFLHPLSGAVNIQNGDYHRL